jgi:hypothetical protein
VGQERFDSELLEMEYELSDICGDHTFRIGFWGGEPINFALLRPKRCLTGDFFAKATAKLLGKSEHEARRQLALGQQRSDWTAGVHRGYCGWLMTNRAFLDEHRQIFEDWSDEVAQNGIPNMGPAVCDTQAIADAQLADGEMERFIREFEEFFTRWRLEGMPAPFVPQPMGIHLPVTDLRPMFGHMCRGGTTFFIPDVFPVPSRDNLREILEEALRDRDGPDHLTEWFEIVHSDNVAKNQIVRYARLFEVQHYVSAFYARHESALYRKKSALIRALANYLGATKHSIEKDLHYIATRLGAEWHLAGR